MSTLALVLSCFAILVSLIALFGLSGVNQRVLAVRRMLVTSPTFESDGPTPAIERELSPGTVALFVNETCAACRNAITEFERLAPSGPSTLKWAVFTPDPGGMSLAPPIECISDSELYRRYYPGACPSVLFVAPHGDMQVARVDETAGGVRKALEQCNAL